VPLALVRDGRAGAPASRLGSVSVAVKTGDDVRALMIVLAVVAIGVALIAVLLVLRTR
jgi:hypothetical protein